MGAVNDPEHVAGALSSITEEVPAQKPTVESGVDEALAYVRDDSYTQHPAALLGRIFFQRVGEERLTPFLFSLNLSVDAESELLQPLPRAEVVLTHDASVGVEVLNLVSGTVGVKELYEMRIVDNVAVRAPVVGQQWETEIGQWLNRPESQRLLRDVRLKRLVVATGVVQKYVSTKRFREFDGSVKGGGYGVNVNGRLYCSSSSYDLSIAYGLSLQSLEAVIPPAALRGGESRPTNASVTALSASELTDVQSAAKSSVNLFVANGESI